MLIEAHGVRFPAIGFGTGSLMGDACLRALSQALRAGYRHIDTASSYGNEVEIGEAIRSSGLRRDEIFLTTKVWPDSLGEAEMLASAEGSLRRLGVDQVDLFLIHWPNPKLRMRDMIAALNAVRARGLARHIGVSNFTSGLLEEAWAATDAPLVANQCEYHPLLDQTRLLRSCRAKGTALVAYMPLGRGKVLELQRLAAIGRRLRKTPGQIALRWLVQQGVGAIPKSTHPERLRQNLEVFDFHLSDREMADIFALARPDGRMIPYPRMRSSDGVTLEPHPEFAPVWDV